MSFHSKYDRVLRRFVPSIAKLSYDPCVKIIGDAIARLVAWPFPELKELPPNHLRIRVGSGNLIFNSHVNFIQMGDDVWLTFLSRNYCAFNSDVVELGCGCGRLARPLRDPPWDPWFQGTYVGVDIDSEMIEYCRSNFPVQRFE